MTKLIAETAWHHEGDFSFMKKLVTELCNKSSADIVKMHITLDLDEYMTKDHEAYEILKSWMFTAQQWESLIDIVRASGKELMLLLNDSNAIEFASRFSPEFVELHSVCLNVPRLQTAILDKINQTTKIVIGVGGCTLEEIDAAVEVFKDRSIILMFGFQNYPTKYQDINLSKIRKIQSLYFDKKFGYADHCAWNEENNELITLLVSANGMDYVEKHVTTDYGKQRCDYSAAVSIDMMNSLADKVNLLGQLYGDGSLGLNSGERIYSQYGPMKMAAIAMHSIEKEEILSENDVYFRRTSSKTDLSQIDTSSFIGKVLVRSIEKGDVFTRSNFE